MSARMEWIEYKEKRICYVDYSRFGRDSAALRQTVEAADAVIVMEPPGSVLCLANVEGTTASPETLNIFKESTLRTRSYICRLAVIGVGVGLRQLFLDSVVRFSGRGIRAFPDAESAKEWLIRE